MRRWPEEISAQQLPNLTDVRLLPLDRDWLIEGRVTVATTTKDSSCATED